MGIDNNNTNNGQHDNIIDISNSDNDDNNNTSISSSNSNSAIVNISSSSLYDNYHHHLLLLPPGVGMKYSNNGGGGGGVATAALIDPYNDNIKDVEDLLNKEWEYKYRILDKLYSDAGNHEEIINIVKDLSNINKYGYNKLNSKWYNREWCGMNIEYGIDYRLLDGMREVMVESLMELGLWDDAINIILITLNDKYTPYSVLTQMNIHLMHSYIRKGDTLSAYHRIRQIGGGGGEEDMILIPQKVKADLDKSFGWNCHIAIIQFENKHYNEALKAAEKAKKAATTTTTTMRTTTTSSSKKNKKDKVEEEEDNKTGISSSSSPLLHQKQKQQQYPHHPWGVVVDEPYFHIAWVSVIIAWCRGLISSNNFNTLKHVIDNEWEDVIKLDKNLIDENSNKRIIPFGRIRFLRWLCSIIRSVGCNGTFNNEEVRWLFNKLDYLCDDIRKDTRVGSSSNAAIYSKDLQDASLLSSFGKEQEYKPWHLQIDADEVGNEARYANHADDPNAALVLRPQNGGGPLTRWLVATRDIMPGEEITTHYGPTYWDILINNKVQQVTFNNKGEKYINNNDNNNNDNNNNNNNVDNDTVENDNVDNDNVDNDNVDNDTVDNDNVDALSVSSSSSSSSSTITYSIDTDWGSWPSLSDNEDNNDNNDDDVVIKLPFPAYNNKHDDGFEYDNISSNNKRYNGYCEYYNGVMVMPHDRELGAHQLLQYYSRQQHHHCAPAGGGGVMVVEYNRIRDPMLKVVKCDRKHPAYPGNKLIALYKLNKGSTICIYGGIMRRYADKIMDVLNGSHYIISVIAPTYSSYGLEIDDSTLQFKSVQKEYPSFAPFSNKRRVLGNDGAAGGDLSSIKNINGLGKDVTKLIISRLIDPIWHPTIQYIKHKFIFNNNTNNNTNTTTNGSSIKSKNLAIAMKYLGPNKKPLITYKGMFIPPPLEGYYHHDDDYSTRRRRDDCKSDLEWEYVVARGKALLNRTTSPPVAADVNNNKEQQYNNGQQDMEEEENNNGSVGGATTGGRRYNNILSDDKRQG